MNIKKMLSLAKFMDKLPRKKFNMNWFVKGKEDKLCEIITRRNFDECGTTCCIAGWQALRIGTKVDAKKRIYETEENAYHFQYDVTQKEIEKIATDDLELETYEAHKLFYNFSLKTPKQAAKFIRKMIEQEKENR